MFRKKEERLEKALKQLVRRLLLKEAHRLVLVDTSQTCLQTLKYTNGLVLQREPLKVDNPRRRSQLASRLEDQVSTSLSTGLPTLP